MHPIYTMSTWLACFLSSIGLHLVTGRREREREKRCDEENCIQWMLNVECNFRRIKMPGLLCPKVEMRLNFSTQSTLKMEIKAKNIRWFGKMCRTHVVHHTYLLVSAIKYAFLWLNVSRDHVFSEKDATIHLNFDMFLIISRAIHPFRLTFSRNISRRRKNIQNDMRL